MNNEKHRTFYLSGVKYRPFEGCINNIEINGEHVDLVNDVIRKGAVMSGCPKA